MSGSPPCGLCKHCKLLTIIMSDSFMTRLDHYHLSASDFFFLSSTHISKRELRQDRFYIGAQVNAKRSLLLIEFLAFHEAPCVAFSCVCVLWQRWRKAWELLSWQKLFLVHGSHKPTWTEKKRGERGNEQQERWRKTVSGKRWYWEIGKRFVIIYSFVVLLLWNSPSNRNWQSKQFCHFSHELWVSLKYFRKCANRKERQQWSFRWRTAGDRLHTSHFPAVYIQHKFNSCLPNDGKRPVWVCLTA